MSAFYFVYEKVEQVVRQIDSSAIDGSIGDLWLGIIPLYAAIIRCSGKMWLDIILVYAATNRLGLFQDIIQRHHGRKKHNWQE